MTQCIEPTSVGNTRRGTRGRNGSSVYDRGSSHQPTQSAQQTATSPQPTPQSNQTRAPLILSIQGFRLLESWMQAGTARFLAINSKDSLVTGKGVGGTVVTSAAALTTMNAADLGPLVQRVPVVGKVFMGTLAAGIAITGTVLWGMKRVEGVYTRRARDEADLEDRLFLKLCKEVATSNTLDLKRQEDYRTVTKFIADKMLERLEDFLDYHARQGGAKQKLSESAVALVRIALVGYIDASMQRYAPQPALSI